MFLVERDPDELPEALHHHGFAKRAKACGLIRSVMIGDEKPRSVLATLKTFDELLEAPVGAHVAPILTHEMNARTHVRILRVTNVIRAI
jgi:hypothetical protein